MDKYTSHTARCVRPTSKSYMNDLSRLVHLITSLMPGKKTKMTLKLNATREAEDTQQAILGCLALDARKRMIRR